MSHFRSQPWPNFLASSSAAPFWTAALARVLSTCSVPTSGLPGATAGLFPPLLGLHPGFMPAVTASCFRTVSAIDHQNLRYFRFFPISGGLAPEQPAD